MKEYSLCGVWDAEGHGPDGKTLRFSGTVPGCVHTDLMREGVLPELFWRDNNRQAQWIENWSWEYRTRFDAPLRENAELVFEGLDTYCAVWLNDTLLGTCEDMFLSYRFPVEALLKPKGNELRVCFDSPIERTKNLPKLDGAFTTERLHTRRVQCTYGWDWVDRFVTCGIWKAVTLRVPESSRLENYHLFTRCVDTHGAQLSFEANFSHVDGESALHLTIEDPEGRTVLCRTRRIVEMALYESLEIENPELWYPNGYGEAKLYTLRLCVRRGEAVLQEQTRSFGIRTLRILQRPDAPQSEYARRCRELKKAGHLSGENAKWDRNGQFSGFTVLVNDVPVFCKGACWVPDEPLMSARKEEKTARLLWLAKEAGVNMIRVWGGGIFEYDWFYDWCDRLGLLVTQDFLMACGTYPDNEDTFCEALAAEAEQAVLRLRNHPCLAWWSGDNENAVEADDNLSVYPGRRVVRRYIEPVVRRLDPARDFLPSSPYNGVPYASATVGTTHNTQFIGDWFSYIRFHDMADYRTFFDSFLARFVAEEPTMGAPMFCTLRKFMSPEDIFGEDMSMWRYHTKNNPAEAFREFELFDYLLAIAEKLLGKFRGPVDRVVKMQYVQYEWVRVTMELFRRNKGFSWGLLYWMLSDCWPGCGWSLIDYYALPKLAYYAFRRAAKGQIAAIEKKDGAYRVFVCNDTLQTAEGSATLRLLTPERTLRRWKFQYACAQNASACVFSVPAAEAEPQLLENALLVCDIEGDRAFFTERSPAFLRLPEPELTVCRAGEACLRITAKSFLYAVILDGEYLFSDNGFLLLPGETREVSFAPAPGARSKRLELYLPGCERVRTIFTETGEAADAAQPQ